MKTITKREFDALSPINPDLVVRESDNGYDYETVVDEDGNEIAFASYRTGEDPVYTLTDFGEKVTATIPPELFLAAATALHGEQWRLPLAGDLGINERTLRRWAAGTSPIRRDIAADLIRLLEDRQAGINGVLERLRLI